MTINTEKLREQFDHKLDTMIEHFYQNVPGGVYQKDSAEIDKNYYRRHCIETILRIRHKRMIDALVVHHFTKTNPRAAKMWANYTEDEMLHGQMFARDLEKLFGTTADEIYQHEPMLATKLLNGYFYFTLEHEGPMAAIASAYFLEYTTRKTQPEWLENLAKVFGQENIRGARAHVEHDIKDNHSAFVWKVLMETVHNQQDVERLMQHVEHIYGLFAAYFVELQQKTLDTNTKQPAAVAAINFSRAVA